MSQYKELRRKPDMKIGQHHQPLLFYFFTFGCAGSSMPQGLFSSCSDRGLLLAAGRGLVAVASPVAAHRLQDPLTLGFQQLRRVGAIVPVPRLQSAGSVVMALAQLLRATWDPPGQGSHSCLLRWQADSLPLRHQGSPVIVVVTIIEMGMTEKEIKIKNNYEYIV